MMERTTSGTPLMAGTWYRPSTAPAQTTPILSLAFTTAFREFPYRTARKTARVVLQPEGAVDPEPGEVFHVAMQPSIREFGEDRRKGIRCVEGEGTWMKMANNFKLTQRSIQILSYLTKMGHCGRLNSHEQRRHFIR